jgi:hypothetical protein
MSISRIPNLIFLSVFIFIDSCNSYRHMQKTESRENCVQKFIPQFDRVMYKTSADVQKIRISGLLLIKRMPDSSVRIVFTNESGFPFFDFGFGPDTGFTVYHITPGMDKKYLITTLRKDFELILFRNIDSTSSFVLRDSQLVYHAYPQSKGINYYVTDIPCRQLVKMQRASKSKPVVEASFPGNINGNVPDSIIIRHLNFNFTISLKKIPGLAAE